MGDIMRVRTVITGFNGQPGYMTFYFASRLVAPNNEHAVNACTRVKDALISLGGLVPVAWHYQVDSNVDVLNDVDGEIDHSLSGQAFAGNGTGATGYGPGATGMLVRWITNVRLQGKLLSGKTFIVPIGPNSDGDGTPSAGAIASTTDFGNALLEGGLIPTIDPVIWRRPRKANSGKNHNLPQRDGTSAKIVSFIVPDKFAVLRSRRD